jgi:hypothetical protein
MVEETITIYRRVDRMTKLREETKVLELGNMVYVFEEDTSMAKFPQLEVIDKGNTKEHTYYLSPFRAYGFQVSGGPNGEGSYGVSQFVGLKNLVTGLEKAVAEAVFYEMALSALHDHSRGTGWYPSFEEKQKIDKFTTASYEWVKSLTGQKQPVKKETVKKETVIERMTKQFEKNFKKIK